MSAKLLNPLMSIMRLKSSLGVAKFCKLRLIILQSPDYSKNANISYSTKVEIANACCENFFIKLCNHVLIIHSLALHYFLFLFLTFLFTIFSEYCELC